MLIDWFTVGAQAVNFLILVWLMKRFLYKPILNAIDAREKRIATEAANAAKQKADAEKEMNEFKKKNADFDAQSAALFVKSTDEAKAERTRLIAEARKDAAALSAKLQETSASEERDLHQSVRRRMEQGVFAVARKTLTDLAGTSLEERMSDMFARRLREMDASSKKSLGDAIRAQGGPSVVSSAFDLPEGSRAALHKSINETFSADVQLRFETTPDLICGIELTAKGQKIAWSISDYVSSLENEVKELLKKREKPKPAPAKPEPEAAKPAPAPLKPEPAAAKPEPATIKPEPVVANPEPATAKPEPEAAKPAPAPLKSEPAAAKPEPATTKPEPVVAKSEPAAVNPEPVAVKPDLATAKPKPVVAKPEPATSKPESVDVKPEPATKPEPAAAKPEPATAKPDPTTAKPESVTASKSA